VKKTTDQPAVHHDERAVGTDFIRFPEFDLIVARVAGVVNSLFWFTSLSLSGAR